MLVASPPRTHHAVAKAALEAGKHVLREKPLATGLEDAFDLVEAADRAERFLIVSQNYRYNAPFRAVQRVLDGRSSRGSGFDKRALQARHADALRAGRLQVLDAPPLRPGYVHPPLRPLEGRDRS